jgi:hypothetical protein
LDFILTEDDRMIDKSTRRDSATNKISPSYLPEEVFPGYLELDGVAMDSTTKFSEIKQNLAKRKIDCGFRDCSHPSGIFDENALIYLTLDGGSERSRLRRFSISARSLN